MMAMQRLAVLLCVGAAVPLTSAFSVTPRPALTPSLRHNTVPAAAPGLASLPLGGRISPSTTSSLRMADDKKGDAGGLLGGMSKWIKDAVAENMGNQPEDLPRPKPRAKLNIESSEDPEGGSKPAYDFKFNEKASKLLTLDTEAIASQAKAPAAKAAVAPTPDDGVDRRFYEVTLDRPTGIEFASDLSLKYVYIMEIKENSAADLSPVEILVGDQLCAINGDECIGEPFAKVAELLGKDPSKNLRFRLFRGSKQELLTAVGREDYVATTARVTAMIKKGDGFEEETLEVPAGYNMRDALVEGGVQVYRVQSGRFTNCNGKQLCGTCIVDVVEGAEYTNSKSIDEAGFLRKMPDRYRLSCCAAVYGDVKLKTLPDTGKKFIEFS